MKPSITLALLLLTSAAPLAAQSHSSTDGLIARIGDLKVTVGDVKTSLAALGAKEGAAIRNDPALLNQVVRSLLVQRVLLREAEAGGYEKKPEVAAQLARARDVALTESYLQSVATPPETYPSETELKAAYETARPSIGVPKSWRLAQIFIALPKDADKTALDNAQTRLDAVQKALKSTPADFAKLASAHSEEQASASRSGEIGWLAETQIQPGIREKLGSLKVDAISDPIRLDDGWHLVKVLDAREPYTPTLEQIRSQLVTQLRVEKTRENSQAYLAKLLQENPLAINELALDQIAEAQPN
jgi:parvulin-like peptidyl-prolyl isomerase